MVAFFCVVLRRTMLQEIGFLDPRFGLGLGDDDDLCRRARLEHWKIGLALDVPVWHWHRSTFSLLAAEGVDWQTQYEDNKVYLQRREEEVPMGRILRYLGNRETGHPFIMHVPARDLNAVDMMDLEDRGFTAQLLCRGGLYIPEQEIEVQPFCGAMTTDGPPCSRPVESWGTHCWQHVEETENES